MKHFLLLAGFLLSALIGLSQAVTITATGTVPSAPNPNVIFSIQSGTQGVQFPMMSSTARITMGSSSGFSPAPISLVGIVVFDTTTNSIWYNNGSTWVNVCAASTGGGWLTTGNAGTVDGGNFIGNTDNIPLSFRVNNQASGRIDQINNNTFLGYQSGLNSSSSTSPGAQNTAYGSQSLTSNTFGVSNVAIGWQSLFSNTFGGLNVAIGNLSLTSNTNGEENVAVGHASLRNCTTGSDNSALGYGSLGDNISGAGNTAIGNFSLGENMTGYNNVAIGNSALLSNTSVGNLVAIGDSALFNNTQIHNTAIGSMALYANTTGGDNTAVGYNSILNNTTGNGNTAIGAQTNLGQSGTFNTAVGFGASAVDGITDATAIGSNANVGTSNTIQLGDRNVTAVNSFGTFNTISDGRFKFNIQEDVSGLGFIMKLRPVTYQLDTRKIQTSLASGNQLASFAGYNDNDMRSMSIRRTGFIAQEVEKAADATGFDFDGIKKPQNDRDHYSLSYEEFVVPLVKAVQEQQKEIKDQQKEIEEQRKEIEDLKNLVVEISKK